MRMSMCIYVDDDSQEHSTSITKSSVICFLLEYFLIYLQAKVARSTT